MLRLAEDTRFGGFWLRTLAFAVDVVLASAAGVVVSNPDWIIGDRVEAVGQAVVLVVFWLYFTIAEASHWQATPGKRLLGLRVVNDDGRRLSLLRANARYWLKIASWLPMFAGFIMIGVTSHKQGLHDKLAGTFVIRP